MAQHGHEVVGFTVHVPHYLAQTDYPAAAQALLEQLAKTGSLHLPLKALTEAAEEVKVKVEGEGEGGGEEVNETEPRLGSGDTHLATLSAGSTAHVL